MKRACPVALVLAFLTVSGIVLTTCTAIPVSNTVMDGVERDIVRRKTESYRRTKEAEDRGASHDELDELKRERDELNREWNEYIEKRRR